MDVFAGAISDSIVEGNLLDQLVPYGAPHPSPASLSRVPANSSLRNVSVFSSVLSSFICARSSSSMKSSARWTLFARFVRVDLNVEGAHPALRHELLCSLEKRRSLPSFEPTVL